MVTKFQKAKIKNLEQTLDSQKYNTIQKKKSKLKIGNLFNKLEFLRKVKVGYEKEKLMEQ